jgi:hypothetical protein
MALGDLGRTLVLLGLLLTAAGLIMWLFGALPFVGRLPGDISIERGNFRLYAPIATCLLISLLLTIMLNLFARR